MRDPLRILLVALVAVSLVGGALPPVRAADETATLIGTLLDPSGRPAPDLRAVIEDVNSREEFLSTAADERGEYSLRVPVGQRYRVVAAITPDGNRIPVRGTGPIPVRVPGSYRLPDVLFVTAEEQPPAPPTRTVTPPEPAATGGSPVPPRPWYRRPGGMIGIGLGSVVLIGFATSGGGDDPPPSPINP